MYMLKRGQTFWFSRNLKEFAGQFLILKSGVQNVGQNGYLRFSLKTGNLRDAEKLARRYAVEVDDALDLLEQKQQAATQPITPEDIRMGADHMRSSLLAADEAVYTEAIKAELAGLEVERYPDRDAGLLAQLPPPGTKGDAHGLRQLRQLIPLHIYLATGKVPTGSLDPSYQPFLAAFREVAEKLAKRFQGQTVQSPPLPNTATMRNKCSWDELIAYYIKQHKDLSPKTIALYKHAIRGFAEFTKCLPDDVTRKQAINWRDQLLVSLAPKTALTRINALHSMYLYALRNERLKERLDPFDGVTVVGAKSAKSGRKEYSIESLREVFRDPPKLDDIPLSAGKHAALWIPLLALFTGARREELAGLLTEDVGEANGTLYLHFRDNKLRKLKTDCSERMTPVHKELLRLGFQKYLDVVRQAGAEKLFPGLVRSDGLADWFIPHVRSRIGNIGVMQDIHSFRHNLKTAARNVPLGDEIHDAITGHRREGTGSQYGSIAGVQTLKVELDKISYPGVVLTAPPIPTTAEIKNLTASAKRRMVAGRNRVQSRKGTTS